MAKPVKTKRQYDSTRRKEQAADTRREILEAAERLFERHGYAATTMAAIAAEAGTAYKTVYLAFETKSSILRELWNASIRGADNEAPVAQQQWYREVLEEPDPERKLRLNARNSRKAKLCIAGPLKAIRSAVAIDPDIAALWDRIREEYSANQRAIVVSLEKAGALRKDLTVDRATDILWTLNHPDLWQLLVENRGWTPEEYEQWCGDMACAQLLRKNVNPTLKKK